MYRTFMIFPDVHGIPRGKIVCGQFHSDIQIGCASGVFSKDIFGIPRIFEILATPSGAADIKIRAEDGVILEFESKSDFLFGASSIAIGTVTDPHMRPHPLDFRRILRDYINSNPILKQYHFGAELEFYLQPEDRSFPLQADGQAYAFSSAANFQQCIEAMMSALDHVGIAWTGFSQENHLNQFEFSLKHSAPLQQADYIFLSRFILRNVAARYGLRCTFVPVVDMTGSPSNLHLHISSNNQGDSKMLCRGILPVLYGPFLALCPTKNGRLVRKIDSFSSKKINIGEEDRFKALRIIKSKTDDRIELRTTTSDANPYLVILMILGSIFSGKDYVHDADLFGFEDNIEWDFEKSIDAFSVDSIVRNLLGSEAIDLYTAMKRLEGKQSSKFDFVTEVAKLKDVI